MAAVLQLTRKLIEKPQVVPVERITVRTWGGHEDTPRWLELRRQTFARQQFGVRGWSPDDFEQEFLGKPWWQPGRMWLAETDHQHRLVGSVTLAHRGDPDLGKPVVHWLLVSPAYRGQGIGRLLMATLEAACWDEGVRQIWLETHTGWKEASRFYTALGYLPVDSSD